MRHINTFLVIILLITIFISCEESTKLNDNISNDTFIANPLLFTNAFSWKLTNYYSGYIPDPDNDSSSFDVEIFDTVVYYYAYDSVINFEFPDTSYSITCHYFKYKESGIMYNKTTGEEIPRNFSGYAGLFQIREDERALYRENYYGGWYKLYDFNVEIGDTLRAMVSYATGSPVYYANIVVDTSFVRIGPYRLKRYHWNEIWENGYISNKKGDYVEGIATLRGIIFNTYKKFESFTIDGLEYTPEEIIIEIETHKKIF